MTFRHAGNPSKDGMAGDLLVVVRVENETNFQRVGNDLYLEMPIQYTELVFGCQKEIQVVISRLQ